jgi:hypothetical protein
MRAVSALVAVMVFVFGGISVAVSISIEQAREQPGANCGPIGWEKCITPGFDPPIEYVVVYGTTWIDPPLKVAQCVDKWGPEALPVFKKLHGDPRWAALRQRLLTFIELFPPADTKDFLLSAFEEARAALTGVREDWRLPYSLLSMIRKADPKRADELVEEGLKNPADPCYQVFVQDLFSRALEPGNKDAQARFDQVLQTLPANDSMRSYFVQRLESSKTVGRANEPMNNVLKKVKEGQP